MTDLNRWDQIDSFTAKEAAALILGYDPNDPDAPIWKTVPVLKLMREGYGDAALYVVMSLNQYDSDPESISVDTQGLEFMGEKLQGFYLNTPKFDDQVSDSWTDAAQRLSEWFDSCEKFSRLEISRWLVAKEIESEYQFDLAGQLRQPGKGNGRKLSESQIAEIQSNNENLSQVALSEKYGVSRRTIQKTMEAPLVKAENAKKKVAATPFSGLGGWGATR